MERIRFVPSTDEKPWVAKDLLERPFLVLLESPVECFAPMLRDAEGLPSEKVFEAFYQVLLYRVAGTLLRKNDAAALDAEIDDFRRLVPHARRKKINSGKQRWATRFDTLGDLLDAVLQINRARQTKKSDMRFEHGKRVLKALAEKDGQRESNLCKRAELKSPIRILRRISALLEAGGFVRREAVGRDKKVFLTEYGRKCAERKKL